MSVPRQEVISLPLAPSVRQRLLAAGFRTVADLAGVRPLDLAAEAGLTPDEALLALKLGGSAPAGDAGIAGTMLVAQRRASIPHAT